MKNKVEKAAIAIGACFWIFIVILLLIHRDEITVEGIVGFTPENVFLAILAMLLLFAIKGSTACINGNILYMASGVMFSLPLAVTVNMLGSIMMTTIPFLFGRKGGTGTVERLTQQHKKLELLRAFPQNNQFHFTLLLRILGLLPCEIVSMYLGACQLRYQHYICGTLLGLLPAAVAYSVMGAYSRAPASPQFVAAVIFQIATTICAVIAGGIWMRKRKQGRTTSCNT